MRAAEAGDDAQALEAAKQKRLLFDHAGNEFRYGEEAFLQYFQANKALFK